MRKPLKPPQSPEVEPAPAPPLLTRERFLPEILELIEQGKNLAVVDARPPRELLDDLWGDA